MSNIAPILVPLLLDVVYVASNFEPEKRDIDTLELFSGKMAITKASADLGMKAFGYYKVYMKKIWHGRPQHFDTSRLQIGIERGSSNQGEWRTWGRDSMHAMDIHLSKRHWPKHA